ncbi:MAG: SDR family oxidoreductase [Bacteroidetes bacterium]|nr:MAG: SDR family oxidoreductase [Bacteroidota bacterium]
MKVLITGGASGLGEALSRSLSSEQDLQVYATYCHSEEKAKKIASEFSNLTMIKCDFGNADELSSLCEQISEWDIDVLIHNAYSGTFLGKHFHKTDINQFQEEFQRNVLPVLQLTQAAITHFRKKKFGKIINVLSAALVGNPPIGSAMYVANKAYLQKMTQLWATENARFNISSNSISPAFMRTNFTDFMDERMVEQIEQGHPLKKLLEPKEVAPAVLYFVRASQQVNGTDLLINAGSSIR